jgi:alcohol dehydrogenase class IV
MVGSFQITSTPNLVFGVGKRNELPAFIGKFGRHALIITGAGSFEKSDIGNLLLEKLEKSLESIYLAKVSGEPTPEIVDSIVARFKDITLDVVVAIGGGSVLDAGKAISAMIKKGEPIEQFLEGIGTRQPDGTKLPFIAVPTTAGTGSEATKNAVISKVGEHGYKKSLRHDNYIPNIALVDPELTVSCNKEITAASGMDAFTQLLEAYVSTKSSAFIDLLAFSGIELVIKSLRAAWNDGTNLDARSGMSYAAMLSGIALANAGLGTVHGFASSVGGYYPIPHGIVCGTLMAECVGVNIEKMGISKGEAYLKYAKVGRLFSNDSSRSDVYYCQLLVDSLQELTNELKIPRLSAFGVEMEKFERIVNITDNKNNPVNLLYEDLLQILVNRY